MKANNRANAGEVKEADNKSGKIFQRYNISLGKIEYYLISIDKIDAYTQAIYHQDLDAWKNLGIRITGK